MMYLSIVLMVNSQSESRFEVIFMYLALEQDHAKNKRGTCIITILICICILDKMSFNHFISHLTFKPDLNLNFFQDVNKVMAQGQYNYNDLRKRRSCLWQSLW